MRMLQKRKSQNHCLENQQPLQGFCCSCEGRIYGSDRESPEMRTFKCRALKMETFGRLEGANFAKKGIRKFLWPWLRENHKELKGNLWEGPIDPLKSQDYGPRALEMSISIGSNVEIFKILQLGFLMWPLLRENHKKQAKRRICAACLSPPTSASKIEPRARMRCPE